MNYPLKAVASVAAHHMKEEDGVDESERAVPSTRSEERRSPMRNLVKEMASLCSIHDVAFRYLHRKDEVGVG